MPEPSQPVRLLVLQIRDEPQAERQERECFIGLSGLPAGCFTFHNLVARPTVGLADCADADLVIIGGAGAHSVTEVYPFSAPLADLTRALVAAGRPLFGSCWGHQFIAAALGGTVVTDRAHAEIGTFDIELTAAGRADPWLAGLPPRFPVQLGHNDRVAELPPGAIELAFSARCPNQAFRVAGSPVYGAQFHVELDERRMLERAAVYAAGYLGGGGLEALRRSLRPSPESATLLRRLITLARAARAGRPVAASG